MAEVAELVDALASGASGGNPVEVQVLSSAPSPRVPAQHPPFATDMHKVDRAGSVRADLYLAGPALLSLRDMQGLDTRLQTCLDYISVQFPLRENLCWQRDEWVSA